MNYLQRRSNKFDVELKFRNHARYHSNLGRYGSHSDHLKGPAYLFHKRSVRCSHWSAQINRVLGFTLIIVPHGHQSQKHNLTWIMWLSWLPTWTFVHLECKIIGSICFHLHGYSALPGLNVIWLHIPCYSLDLQA